jgi:hypothetical protein
VKVSIASSHPVGGQEIAVQHPGIGKSSFDLEASPGHAFGFACRINPLLVTHPESPGFPRLKSGFSIQQHP